MSLTRKEYELFEKLLSAAQAVVHDGELPVELAHKRGSVVEIDSEIFADLERAVKALHDDAVQQIELFRQADVLGEGV